jgi:hypothetical protein
LQRFLKDLILQLNILLDTINRHNKETDYIYSDVFDSWVNSYSDLIVLYNRETNGRIQPYQVNRWDYSSSQKTVRESAITSLISSISNLIRRLETDSDEIRNKQSESIVPSHQLRRCFKTGAEGCPVNPKFDKNKIFIGMPFANKYADCYEYGIKIAAANSGHTVYRADSVISNRDIMCKICKEIQASGICVFNISGLNPNVMLELGLALGIGKPIIILKDTETQNISDIGSIEYIEYLHAHDLATKLTIALVNLS